jgi:hypothetical protein
MSDFPAGTVLIEIRGIYDGWSIAHLPTGEYVNRWPDGDRRHEPTQRAIERMLAKEGEAK